MNYSFMISVRSHQTIRQEKGIALLISTLEFAIDLPSKNMMHHSHEMI